MRCFAGDAAIGCRF